ncbi:dual specificity protein phosphatase 3-like [Glandiceps talaboti]
MATQSDASKASCTVEELNEILREPAQGFLMMPSRGEDEVWPRIYVGEMGTAKNISKLQHLGITHVLNVAQGKGFGHVDTDQTYYEKAGIIFKGVHASDAADFFILSLWDDTSDFIHTALKEKDTKVLVHCREGFSRAPSTTIAYLMMYESLTVQEATRAVREKREVGPNEGFLKQLCELDAILLEKRASLK